MSAAAATRSAVLAAEARRRAKPNGWWGMVIFICSEATLFLMVFATYYYLRFKTPHWPPAGIPRPAALLPLVLTAVLVSSSVFVQSALAAARSGLVARARGPLFAALVLQGGYLAAQVHLYVGDLHRFPPSQSAYASIYFTLLGLHHAHVVLGLALELFVLLRLTRGLTTYRLHGLQATVLYWHFVNVAAVLVVLTQLSPWL